MAGIGRSPLGREVSQPKQPQEANRVPSERSSSSKELQDVAEGSFETGDRSFEASAFDSDPAQIVSLALNLSENRRRHFSTGRVTSLEPSTGRRRISTPHVGGIAPSTPAIGSLKHHLSQQRRGSRTISPRADRTPSMGKRTAYASGPNGSGLGLQSQLIPEVDLGTLVDPTFSPSDATLLRAERAKVAIELSYEHRRLLQYLPALPACVECRPSTGRTPTARGSELAQPLGRVYNPLQYIRNRKVRVRERQTLDSEADGWKDVDSVRAWVGQVGSERRNRVSKVDDEYTLPEFSGRKEEVDDPAQITPASPTSGLRSAQAKKLSRHRNDWTTTPWDLLGDHYWVDQGSNKHLVEDTHRHKIHGNGFGRPEQVQPYPRRSHSISRVHATPERVMTSKSLGEDLPPRDRGRPSHQRQTSFQSMRSWSSSRDRKSRWPRKFIRSRSSTSSEDSDEDMRPRRKGQDARDYQYSRMLDRQLEAFLEREQRGNWKWGDIHDMDDGDTTDPRSTNVSAFSSRHPSFGPDDQAPAGPKRAKHNHTLSKIASDLHTRSNRKSDPVDNLSSRMTDPVSSTTDIPSIAISDTSTRGRSVSPVGDRPQANRSILSEMSKEREQIQDIDFAADPAPNVTKSRHSHELTHDTITPRVSNEQPNGEATRKLTKLKRRRSDERLAKEPRIRKETDSRFRSLLKGARLSDIVSSPVNKVGDYIWRRDVPDVEEEHGSIASDGTSDTETEGKPSIDLSRTDTGMSRTSTEQEPHYHMSNLPVFRSPFASERSENMSDDQDHISRQQSALRQQRSRRLERLAPPGLDMRSISPSPAPPPERVDDAGATSDDSRRPSVGGDRRFAVVEGSPDPKGRRHYVTGNQAAEVKQKFQNDVGFMNLHLQPLVPGKLSRQDIVRLSALITSTRIKASQIVQRAASIRDPPHPILQELRLKSDTPFSPIPQAQEGVVIGGLLVKQIDDKNAAIRDVADKFTHETMGSMQQDIRGLDEYITNKVTGMVRKAADDADDLSSKLAADCTMEVKWLNENIDLVLRRRRRRLRWIRRGGFALLEWTLLGLMWMVWLLVVIFRIGRGAVRAMAAVVRWLLWMS
jgi:hypothetical protein